MPLQYLYTLRVLYRAFLKTSGYDSMLGLTWGFLNPLLSTGVLFVIFNGVLSSDLAPSDYFLFTLTGNVFWNFFSAGTHQGTICLRSRTYLLRNFNFRRETVVFAQSLSIASQHLMQIALLFLILILFGKISVEALVFFPIAFLAHLIIVVGLNLALSIAGLYVRDFSYIWSIFVRVGFFVTPVCYPIERMPELAKSLIALNPLSYVIDIWRRSLIDPASIHLLDPLILLVLGIFLFLGCLFLYRSTESRWIENA